jgi:hypothetical protein
MSELPAEKLGYSPTEAMNAIACSKVTLYKYIRAGRLDARRLGEHRTIITKQSLQALIEPESEGTCGVIALFILLPILAISLTVLMGVVMLGMMAVQILMAILLLLGPRVAGVVFAVCALALVIAHDYGQ